MTGGGIRVGRSCWTPFSAGRPTYLDTNRARIYCACSICRTELFGHFSLLFLFLFFSFCLGDGGT